MKLSTELRVDKPLIDAFASATGDFSSIHVDAEFARRTRYRSRIAHGMILINMLNVLSDDQSGQALRLHHLEGKFLNPVTPDTIVRLDLETGDANDGQNSAEAIWTDANSGQVLCKATAAYTLAHPESQQPGTAGCLITDTLSEAALDISAMESARAGFDFLLDDGPAMKTLREIANGAINSRTLVSTLMLSALVGMCLPGRFATFLGFSISFASEPAFGSRCTVTGETVKTAASVGTAELAFQIVQDEEIVATGSVTTLVNPKPVSQPPFSEFVRQYAPLRLDGQTAVVIGGSRGIGEATVKLFAALGANVVLTYYRGAGDAQRIASEISDAGGSVMTYQCDVRQEADVSTLIEATLREFGTLDILVNNAVFTFNPTPFEKLSWSGLTPELEVSLKGLHLACEYAVPAMKKNGRGKIVNISSTIVNNPAPGQLGYITAKSAIIGYTKALAKEIGRHNIHVNLVVPSMTETDLVGAIPEQMRKRLAEANSARRNIHAHEVAQAICFLASGWSDTMNGQQIVLNMGQPPFAV